MATRQRSGTLMRNAQLIASVGLMALTIGCSPARGQGKRAMIHAGGEIAWAGVDRAGDLLLVLSNGELQKFEKSGKQIAKTKFAAPPSLIDPLDGASAFFYIRSLQKYGSLFGTDLRERWRKDVDPAFAVTPWLVCPSMHELWILDSADLSISKTSLNSATITLESALRHLPDKAVTDYTYLKEYQNYLFLLDQKAGVHMFNSLGKFVRTFGEEGLNYFSFLGEEIYFIKGDQLVFVDLYTQEKRSIPLPQSCRFALLNDDTLYAVGRNEVGIFDFKP